MLYRPKFPQGRALLGNEGENSVWANACPGNKVTKCMGQCLSRKQGWQSVWANTQPGNKGDKMWGPTPSQETRVTKCEGQRSARKQGWQQCMGYRSPRKQFLADRLSGGQCFLVDRLWVVDNVLTGSEWWTVCWQALSGGQCFLADRLWVVDSASLLTGSEWWTVCWQALSGGQCFLVDRLWVVDSHLGISDIWISAFCIHFCECLWAFKQMWEQVVGIIFFKCARVSIL